MSWRFCIVTLLLSFVCLARWNYLSLLDCLLGFCPVSIKAALGSVTYKSWSNSCDSLCMTMSMNKALRLDPHVSCLIRPVTIILPFLIIMQHFERVLCSSSLHLFDQKYRKTVIL